MIPVEEETPLDAMFVFTGRIRPAANNVCYRVANVIVVQNLDTGQREVIQPHDDEWNHLLEHADEDDVDG